MTWMQKKSQTSGNLNRRQHTVYCCTIKIMSVQLHPLLKPHCACGSPQATSSFCTILQPITQLHQAKHCSKTIATMKLPFLEIGTRMASCQSCSTCFSFQTAPTSFVSRSINNDSLYSYLTDLQPLSQNAWAPSCCFSTLHLQQYQLHICGS